MFKKIIFPLLLIIPQFVLFAQQPHKLGMLLDASEKTYLFLREVGKSNYLKFGIRGNTITLFVDNYILKSGKEYQWAISPKLFPDLEAIKKHQFKILTENDYNILLQKHDQLIKSLVALGIDGEDLKSMLLNNYANLSKVE